MKNFLKTAVLALCIGACAIASATPTKYASAALDESLRPINLFEKKSNWAFASDAKNSITLDTREMEITPIGITTATYCVSKMGESKISFTYQLEYADPSIKDAIFDPTDHTYPFFFGVLFANNPPAVINATPNLGVPYGVPGGYPYMLAFDLEVQGAEPNRVKQCGMMLRRYKAGGSHDYTIWAATDPTEETFINNAGVEYESKMPAYNKAVGVEDCFDEDQHKVDIAMDYLYKSEGDEYDAVKIDVWFDDELSLTVIDEMPFIGEDYGDEIDVDKRGSFGWLSFYTFNGFNGKELEYWDYKIHLTSFSAIYEEPVDAPSIPSDPSTSEEESAPAEKKSGCGSTIGVASTLSLLMVAAFVGFSKKENE